MTTVLVVDDDRSAAEDYARLVRQRTGLAVSASDDPDEAAAVVARGGVAVLVLDQQMPRSSGTELFSRLRGLDARVRGILLTGEATTEEVGDALNQGFARYVHKAQALQELAGAVRHEFIEYQNSLLLEVSADQPVLARRRRGILGGTAITYRFIGLQILDQHFVRESDWQEVVTLQAGQTQRVKLTRGEAWALQLEEEETAKIGAIFSIGSSQVVNLTSKLQSEVSSRLKSSFASNVTEGLEAEQTFQLPAEPGEVGQLHVRARRVQQAPVFVRARVELLEECGCCGRPNLLSVLAYVATGSLALRHVDHLSDGSQRILELGRAGSPGH